MFWLTLLPFTRLCEWKQLLTLLWLQTSKCMHPHDDYTVTFNVKNRRYSSLALPRRPNRKLRSHSLTVNCRSYLYVWQKNRFRGHNSIENFALTAAPVEFSVSYSSPTESDLSIRFVQVAVPAARWEVHAKFGRDHATHIAPSRDGGRQ